MLGKLATVNIQVVLDKIVADNAEYLQWSCAKSKFTYNMRLNILDSSWIN